MPTGLPSLVSRRRTPRRGVSTVGLDAFLDAFLDLEATFEEEGLFDGGVWIAELHGLAGGFIVVANDEITWTNVDPTLYRRGIARTTLQHVRREASAPLELEELDGNEASRAVYESVGFVVGRTTTGKLAGNESLQATGHTMRWKPSDWATVVDASVSAAAPTTSLVSFRKYCAESVL